MTGRFFGGISQQPLHIPQNKHIGTVSRWTVWNSRTENILWQRQWFYCPEAK